MIVWFAAVILLLFYLSQVPVKFALVLHISARPALGAGVAAFEGRFALRRAMLRAANPKKRRCRPAQPDLQAALPAAMKAGRFLLPRLHPERLEITGRLSCADAANTALACGLLHTLEGVLTPFAPDGAVSLHPDPDFSAARSALCLRCMLSVSAGHIIIAAIIGARQYILRRASLGKASH